MATTDQLRKAQSRQQPNQWRREQYAAVLADAGFTGLSKLSRLDLYKMVRQNNLYGEVERRFIWQNNGPAGTAGHVGWMGGEFDR